MSTADFMDSFLRMTRVHCKTHRPTSDTQRLSRQTPTRNDRRLVTAFGEPSMVAAPHAGVKPAVLRTTLTPREPQCLQACPKWVSTKAQPIAIGDVLACLSFAPDQPSGKDRILEIGGPDLASHGDLMREHAPQCGLKRLTISVPFLSVRLFSLCGQGYSLRCMRQSAASWLRVSRFRLLLMITQQMKHFLCGLCPRNLPVRERCPRKARNSPPRVGRMSFRLPGAYADSAASNWAISCSESEDS